MRALYTKTPFVGAMNKSICDEHTPPHHLKVFVFLQNTTLWLLSKVSFNAGVSMRGGGLFAQFFCVRKESLCVSRS